jgi:hypothetical protein
MCVDRSLALQLGFLHPSFVCAASAVGEEFVPVVVSLPRIIPWASRVEITSADVVIGYNEGITGSHFGVGGIDLMIIPLQVSSDM